MAFVEDSTLYTREADGHHHEGTGDTTDIRPSDSRRVKWRGKKGVKLNSNSLCELLSLCSENLRDEFLFYLKKNKEKINWDDDDKQRTCLVSLTYSISSTISNVQQLDCDDRFSCWLLYNRKTRVLHVVYNSTVGSAVNLRYQLLLFLPSLVGSLSHGVPRFTCSLHCSRFTFPIYKFEF